MIKRNLYSFGERSEQRRKDVSGYLKMCSDKAIEASPIDFGVANFGGLRTAEQQKGLFDKKYSKCDGYKKLSYHQKTDDEGKGLALDLVPYIKGKGFSYKAKARFGIIGALMLEAWDELQKEGKIPKDLYLHWGGFWSSKSKMNLGWDLPHYEIRTKKQNIKV